MFSDTKMHIDAVNRSALGLQLAVQDVLRPDTKMIYRLFVGSAGDSPSCLTPGGVLSTGMYPRDPLKPNY